MRTRRKAHPNGSPSPGESRAINESSESAPGFPDHDRTASSVSRFGFWIAAATALMTILAFGLALTALPDRVPYPFAEQHISDQWPGDYYWLFPAMVLMLLFVALVAALHLYAPGKRKTYSLLALCLAVIAAEP